MKKIGKNNDKYSEKEDNEDDNDDDGLKKKIFKLINNKIHDYFYKPTYIIHFDKIENNYRNSCLKTINQSTISIDEKLNDKKDKTIRSFVDEFESNQFFIYLHGLRFTGLNYLFYIFTYVIIFVCYIFITSNRREAIYLINKYLSWIIVLLIATFGKIIMSSFTSTRKWTYVNNLRLYDQIKRKL